jgi:hypothetical protein
MRVRGYLDEYLGETDFADHRPVKKDYALRFHGPEWKMGKNGKPRIK